MSRQRALYQSLAASGAAVITFVGVCHEAVGATLFPWGPAFLGGPIGWHGTGLVAIATGLGLVGGALGLFPFPVVQLSLLASAIGVFFVVATAVLHGQFHVFALAVVCCGALTAYCHRRATASPEHALDALLALESTTSRR
jgi:hypothetical protein